MGQYDFPVPTIVSRFASTALLLYDIIITLDDEVTYIWRSKWSLPKVLYLFIRYIGLAAAIFSCIISVNGMSDRFCSIYAIYKSVWLLVTAGVGDALLTLRVLALYKDKNKTCIALRAAYGTVYIIELIALCYYISSVRNPFQQTYPENLGCVMTTLTEDPTVTSPEMDEIVQAIVAAPVIILNFTLLITVFANVAPLQLRMKRASGGYAPLMTSLLRDGAMYFVLMTAATIFLAVVPLTLYRHLPDVEMGAVWFYAIGALAPPRLFLNLRTTAGKAKGLLTHVGGRTEIKLREEGDTVRSISFTVPLEGSSKRTSEMTSDDSV